MRRPEHIENLLTRLHPGQWFGWDNKEKVYANLVIHSDDDKPTQEWLEAELKSQQDAYDNAAAAKVTNTASTKTKLEALGLTVDEIKDVFGI